MDESLKMNKVNVFKFRLLKTLEVYFMSMMFLPKKMVFSRSWVHLSILWMYSRSRVPSKYIVVSVLKKNYFLRICKKSVIDILVLIKDLFRIKGLFIVFSNIIYPTI